MQLWSWLRSADKQKKKKKTCCFCCYALVVKPIRATRCRLERHTCRCPVPQGLWEEEKGQRVFNTMYSFEILIIQLRSLHLNLSYPQVRINYNLGSSFLKCEIIRYDYWLLRTRIQKKKSGKKSFFAQLLQIDIKTKATKDIIACNHPLWVIALDALWIASQRPSAPRSNLIGRFFGTWLLIPADFIQIRGDVSEILC